ncbi:sensor histidine kinase [Halomonas sp. CnH100-B]|uniref:sensor histidine kinase n=1 Tax=Halomonas sp. CnH100-B TaxID=2954490 RepID=UPI0020982992|nr:sensor histidine kinase [Halomonas sp. CnH100-B]MCO7228422.1 sensor histidine kinase [Halomonas sp. CnH100-B]
MTERVLDNLISNAIAYSPAGGNIKIIIGHTDGQPEVHVQDDGPGIAPKDLPHIFEPFYRGDVSGSTGHAGLGLAIARRIMTLQGRGYSGDEPSRRGRLFLPAPTGLHLPSRQ